MLYFVAISQILIYLFFIPLLRCFVDKSLLDYSFFASIYFFVFFTIGGLIASRLNNIKKDPSDIFEMPKNKNFRWYLIIAWMLACIAISLNYGLYDRRIGTESAAELFGGISPYYLLIFRTFEISNSFFMALAISEFYSYKKINFSNSVILILFIGTIFLLGVASSRSWAGIILFIIIIIMQNKLKKGDLRKLIYRFSIASVLIFFLVTAVRISSGDDRGLFEYFSAELLQRIDGLEIISQLIDLHGYSLFGINYLSLLNPIISSIPFFEVAKEIKINALTTIKSVILEEELRSGSRDINSFILLDVYYWGGLVGVGLVAVAVGFFAKLVDLRIGVTKSYIYQILLVSVTINIVVLEREAIGIFMNIIRDWFILFIVANIFTIRRKNIN